MKNHDENFPKPGKGKKKVPVDPEAQKALFGSLIAKETKLLTTADLMQLYNVCAKTIYRWRDKKLLPHTKMNGTYYYSKAVLSHSMGFRMHA